MMIINYLLMMNYSWKRRFERAHPQFERDSWNTELVHAIGQRNGLIWNAGVFGGKKDGKLTTGTRGLVEEVLLDVAWQEQGVG